jgi:glycosyltransferase involved in cell wall biosynthesis
MPSRYESFSIVTLEAMAQGTPVLVEGKSPVLSDLVKQSGAGRIYDNYESFEESLSEILMNENKRSAMGDRGRECVLSRYQSDEFKKSLFAAVES